MTPEQRAIYDYIAEHPGCSAAEIVQGLGVGMSTIRSRMDRMKADYLLIVTGSVRWQRYWACQIDPEWIAPDEYIQAPSIWRVATRCAADARGVEWRSS